MMRLTNRPYLAVVVFLCVINALYIGYRLQQSNYEHLLRKLLTVSTKDKENTITSNRPASEANKNDIHTTRSAKSKYPEWITSYLPPDVKDLNDANISTLYQIYHSFSDAVEIPCARRVRLGGLKDGGWSVCDYGDFELRKPCLVYSFGINREWSFDDATEKFYQCEIHSFDPSMGLKDHDRSKLIHFHATGLSLNNSDGQVHKWRMRTLSSIKKELGHEDKLIDVLKMDIESHEWGALSTSIMDFSLRNVKQLAVEFHISPKISRERVLVGVKVLLELYKNGFRKFSSLKNVYNRSKQTYYTGTVSTCAEVGYLNMRFVTK